MTAVYSDFWTELEPYVDWKTYRCLRLVSRVFTLEGLKQRWIQEMTQNVGETIVCFKCDQKLGIPSQAEIWELKLNDIILFDGYDHQCVCETCRRIYVRCPNCPTLCRLTCIDGGLHTYATKTVCTRTLIDGVPSSRAHIFDELSDYLSAVNTRSEQWMWQWHDQYMYYLDQLWILKILINTPVRWHCDVCQHDVEQRISG